MVDATDTTKTKSNAQACADEAIKALENLAAEGNDEETCKGIDLVSEWIRCNR